MALQQFETIHTATPDLVQVQENVRKAVNEILLELEGFEDFDTAALDAIRARLTAIENAYIKSVTSSGNTLTFTLQDNSTFDYTPNIGDLEFRLDFNATTDWTLDTGTGEFFIDFNHNRNMLRPEWSLFNNTGNGIGSCVMFESTTRLRITRRDAERFAGYMIVR